MRNTKSVVLAMVLALVASIPGMARAQDRPSDSIKVHGHWVIEVHNPDGSLASHTEFENALVQDSASPFLASLLARNVSVGFWSITLGGDGVMQPCNNPLDPIGVLPTPCHISEPSAALSNSQNLGVTVTAAALRFSGSVTTPRGAAIQYVSTEFVQCGPTLNAAASCPDAVSGTFTSRSLAQPVPVAAGQIVQVTVTISFS
jgi:hypothetical protein